jgi:hypothetical protein
MELVSKLVSYHVNVERYNNFTLVIIIIRPIWEHDLKTCVLMAETVLLRNKLQWKCVDGYNFDSINDKWVATPSGYISGSSFIVDWLYTWICCLRFTDRHVFLLYADVANWTANLRACLISVPVREGMRFAWALQAIEYFIVPVRPHTDSFSYSVASVIKNWISFIATNKIRTPIYRILRQLNPLFISATYFPDLIWAEKEWWRRLLGGRPGFDFLQGQKFLFATAPKYAFRAYPEDLSPELKRPGYETDHSLPLPRLRMRGSIPPLSHTSWRVA